MKNLVVAAIAVLSLAACGGAAGAGALPVAPAGSTPTVVLTAIGDSITQGGKLSKPSTAWPYLVGRDFGIAVHNQAISGATSPTALARQLPVPPDTTVAIINLGSNDVLDSVNPANPNLAQDEAAYLEIVTTLQREGIRVFTVQVRNWDPQARSVSANVRDWNAFISAVPSTTFITLDQYHDMYDPANFDVLFLHPNDSGNALLAEHIEAALRANGL